MSKLYVFLSPIAGSDVENVCAKTSKMYVPEVQNVCDNTYNLNVWELYMSKMYVIIHTIWTYNIQFERLKTTLKTGCINKKYTNL